MYTSIAVTLVSFQQAPPSTQAGPPDRTLPAPQIVAVTTPVISAGDGGGSKARVHTDETAPSKFTTGKTLL
ncbi:hypothetical protein [Streptomyces sp. NPDC048243]|uniref:hypothetical protein n=1 Tax=Streptomyces sp. NPDC048243 TaxID=3365522 RepID=UPI0037129A87